MAGSDDRVKCLALGYKIRGHIENILEVTDPEERRESIENVRPETLHDVREAVEGLSGFLRESVACGVPEGEVEAINEAIARAQSKEDLGGMANAITRIGRIVMERGRGPAPVRESRLVLPQHSMDEDELSRILEPFGVYAEERGDAECPDGSGYFCTEYLLTTKPPGGRED